MVLAVAGPFKSSGKLIQKKKFMILLTKWAKNLGLNQFLKDNCSDHKSAFIFAALGTTAFL